MMKRVKLRRVRIEAKEDDFELQSTWPQLSKVLKWLVKNNDEEAAEVLELIIEKRKQEIQRKSPEVDIADALRSTIMSMINEGVEVNRLREADKRIHMIPQESDEEN